MDERFQLISALGIVPTFEMDDSRKAVPLARAMAAGGLPIAEVSFRTAAAAESIRRISSECPEVLVGAGDVLTCEQVDQALEAGGCSSVRQDLPRRSFAMPAPRARL